MFTGSGENGSTTKEWPGPQQSRDTKRRRIERLNVPQHRRALPSPRRRTGMCDESTASARHNRAAENSGAMAPPPMQATASVSSYPFPSSQVVRTELQRLAYFSRLMSSAQAHLTGPTYPSINTLSPWPRLHVAMLQCPSILLGVPRPPPLESLSTSLLPAIQGDSASTGRANLAVNGHTLAEISEQRRDQYTFFTSPASSKPSASSSSNNNDFSNSQMKHSQNSRTKTKKPSKAQQKIKASPVQGMTLYTPEDKGKLSDHHILLRKQIEIFCATHDDIMSITRGKNKPIILHQVGFRCRHCSHLPAGRRKKGATYFPSAVMGIYQAAQNLSFEHLQSGLCTELPPYLRESFSNLASGRSIVSGVGKKYWAEAGRKLGLVDTDDGIRFQPN